ncbi:TfoX/Sxy family DNA transformation protein [Pluralibacter gergoviae]|uniref:Competence protein n=1 Tax=Pluralibacter gergoviae TaxID=61647 RepID=A0A089PPY6_PLUGE|nr:TfoX/Sxy family DNA transformation protein [Pluralibacter gergoviae]AIR01993.1 competence protein [Pluralibacter gergoviae]AVR03717.1 competence protein [Pluralibacter gergoviae]EKT9641747.1 TfoX/Sxy family DNA transformation protein [Pluralibacter gergoviae]EKV0913277.1 TfoX/Sxy family DNA transformation protein [Pluralibacter gergoviae]EKV0928465.1 TfoX/Sxy family DNA transformation protein [Pluralibacter gergoviae]
MKSISYGRINKSVECLSSLGDVQHRALFGGYSLSIDDTVFAMVMEGKLYLRACEQSAAYHVSRPDKLLTFNRRGRAVSLNYYLVDDELWRNRPLLLSLSALALEKAQKDKSKRHVRRGLRSLPNITWSLEVLLLEAGIVDEKMLQALGAAAAWYRLRRIRKNLSASVLLALEGAITGMHSARIPEARRQHLLDWAKMLAEGRPFIQPREAPAAEDGKSPAEG